MPNAPPIPMKIVATNNAIPAMAETFFRDEEAVNSCISGLKPWSVKIRAMTSAAARSSSLQAGVISVRCRR